MYTRFLSCPTRDLLSLSKRGKERKEEERGKERKEEERITI